MLGEPLTAEEVRITCSLTFFRRNLAKNLYFSIVFNDEKLHDFFKGGRVYGGG